MIVLKLCLAWPSHAHYVLRVCKSHSWKTKQGSINHSHGQANLSMKASLFVIQVDHKPFLSVVMLVYMCCFSQVWHVSSYLVYRGWGVVGSPLPARHVSGRGLLSGGLLPVSQHLWGSHATLQREEYEEKSSLLSPLATPHRDRVFSMDCLKQAGKGCTLEALLVSCPANSREWARLVEKICRGMCYAWARRSPKKLRAQETFLLNYSASAPALGRLTERHDSTSKPSRWVSSPWPCPRGTSTREVCLPPQRPSPNTPKVLHTHLVAVQRTTCLPN